MATPTTKPARSPREIREERGKLAREIQKIAATVNSENRAMSSEEQTAWDTVNKQYDDLGLILAAAERAADVDAGAGGDPPADPQDTGAASRPAGDDRRAIGRDDYQGKPRGGDGAQVTEQHRNLALRAWFRTQSDLDLTQEEIRACELVGMKPNRRQLVINLYERNDLTRLQGIYRGTHPTQQQRALSAFSASAGGVLVPQSLVNQMEIAMLDFSGILQVAEIMRTATGEKMSWPTANDTSNKGRQVGENRAVVSTTEPTFGATTWDAFTLTSDEILVPTSLLEDAAVDLASVIGGLLGERLGRIMNEKGTTGSGGATWKGLMVAATLGYTTASATSFTADEVLRLVHSVDPAYRNGARFMMHDNIMLALRLLKDGNGQPLWRPGMSEGVPDTIYGYPHSLNQDMDSATTSAKKVMAFGQLQKYKVRQVKEVRMYRLVERHRENDQDAFLAFIRADGNLLDAGVAPVKYLQMLA